MNLQKTALISITSGIFLLGSLAACADGNHRKGSRRQGPPPEAIAACEGMQEGDRVEFSGRRGEKLAATCREINGQLAAVPDDMPKEGGPRKQ